MAIVDLEKRTFECGTPSCPNFAFVKMGMTRDDDGNNAGVVVSEERSSALQMWLEKRGSGVTQKLTIRERSHRVIKLINNHCSFHCSTPRSLEHSIASRGRQNDV
jgi:hypothetical protein